MEEDETLVRDRSCVMGIPAGFAHFSGLDFCVTKGVIIVHWDQLLVSHPSYHMQSGLALCSALLGYDYD